MTGIRRSTNRSEICNGNQMMRLLQICALVLISAVGLAAPAQAQNVDWLVNISDAGFDPTPAGGNVEYTVDVDNNGFDPAPATTITLDIPAGGELLSTSGTITGCAPVPVIGPASVVCNVPPLASLGQASVVAVVRSSVAGVTQLTATVPDSSGGVNDVLTGNNTLTEQTTITAGSDLEISLSVPPTAASGSFVNFDFTVLNNGPNDATSYDVQFTVPAGIVNVTAPAGCSLAGNVYTCSAGALAVGANQGFTFTGQVSAGGGSTVTSAGSVLNVSPPDPVSSNNTATADMSITGGTDLAISKSRSPSGTLLVGDPVTFTLNGSYTGDSPSGITVTDTIPANYSVDSISAPGWDCSASTGQDVNCTRTSGSGAGANVSLGPITVQTTVVSSGTPVNTATISASGPTDSNLANNTATDGGATIQDPVVDLRANKSGPVPPLAVVGNNYSYSISVSNIGNATFEGTVVMVDSIPAGLTVNSVSQNTWSCSPAAPLVGPATLTCTRFYAASENLQTSHAVTLDVTATAAGVLSNGLAVSSPDANIPDLNPANDTTTYDVTAVVGGNSADVSAIKTATLASVAAGDIQTFDLEIVNAGPVASQNIQVIDNFTSLINNSVGATGAGYVGHTITANAASGVSCSTASTGGTSRRLSCNITSLPVCTAGVDCPVITVQVRPGGNGGGRTNSFSAISQTTPDPNLGNNSASASYTLDARADVTVTKSDSPDPIAAGQDLTYVVTARNIANGLSAADNVTITDTLPANLTFISATPSAGSCSAAPAANSVTGPGNDQVVCNLGTIANGAQRTVTIVVRPNFATQGTTLSNGVTITTTTTETDTTNNSATETTAVAAPDVDILVNKDDSVDPVAVGDNTVYTITITNTGPSASENIVMTDTLPTANLTYQSHTVSGAGSCSTVPAVNSLGGTLICSWPYLPAGASETVQVTMRGVAKGTIPNNVTISSDEIVAGFDRLAANNQTSEITTVRTKADVEVASKTATPATVNLNDDFIFTAIVQVNTGPGLAEADNVTFSDNLPSGMVLTGAPTVTVTAGSATSTSCTGAAGGASFTCDLGTVSGGGVVEIAIPVEVVSVSALPQTFTNTASVTTTSLDVNPANNSNSGSVDVGSSSIAGTVYRDFADDGLTPGDDTGVAGVPITLTGTSFDGKPVNLTVNTDAGGNFLFPFIPQGTYTLTRGGVSEPWLSDGNQTAPGSEGGTVASPTEIGAISVPANTAATDYLFPLIPQARVGIAKRVNGTPAMNPDGSFNVTFSLVVENFSLEPLTNMAVTDPLTGALPLFGSYQALGAPATDPMPLGSYTVLAAPSGSCGGANAGFNGAGDATVASGFTLAAGGTCSLDISLRVRPASPGDAFENQATVTGEGQLSGQTPATNPELTDLSDDGANPDPGGNGAGGDAGENDPTPVSASVGPAIALVKTADTTGLSSPPVAGEVITYSFAITNTGNVTLSNVTLTDSLPGIVISGGPIASLAPGATDSTTYTATYALTQADVDAGQVQNQATTTGTDPFGTDVSDLSGATTGDDNPLITPLNPGPAIALVKTADTTGLSSPPVAGEVITYSFAITNTGNVTLSNVTLTDSLPGIVISGGPIASLAPGATDSTTYTATYTLTQADVDAGQVQNQATTTGTPPSGPPVSDLSGATTGDDNPLITPIGQNPAIQLVKSVTNEADLLDGTNAGDPVNYAFTITNTGNVTLNNITLSDALAGVTVSGGPIASLAPGASDSTTFTATYTITAADIAAGEIINTATATGQYGPGNSLSVTDTDTVTATVGKIEAIPEVFPPFTTDGGTTTTMLASDLLNGNPATLATVDITVISSDPEVTLDPATGLITLAPGNPAGPYTVEYQICSKDVPTLCDTTVETVVQGALPGIEVTKTQVLTDNGDGRDDVGDTVTYTIVVENTGNVPLSGVVLSDTLTDLDGGALSLDSGPTFVSASAGSPEGALGIGESATYTAVFTLDLQAVNAHGISNTATATALPVYGPGVPGTPSPISDVSDDGDDLDGNTADDPTVLTFSPFVQTAGVSMTKTTPRDIVRRGDVVPYTITITNDNTFVVGPANIVDTLPPGFVYVPGSATIGGVSATVNVTGAVVTWPNVVIPAAGSTTVTLNARILNGARAGEHVNRVNLFDAATGQPIVNEAAATVRILPEGVFDCGDVIGKVFNDRNGNGYQDPPASERDRAAISDQTYYGGKGKASVLPEAFEEADETGIPGVRLVTADGLVITTDEHGRFSVPCAMLPADRGSNFILKLDPRSLPAGFRVTTENPRVVRLTPGMMSELNFGAAIGPVVRVDLGDAAFTEEGRPKPALVAGLHRLARAMASKPGTVRLEYHVSADATAADVKIARKRMKLVEKELKRAWRGTGRGQLLIEHSIARTGN